MSIKQTESNQSTFLPASPPSQLDQWETASYSCIGRRVENQDRELLITGEKGVLAVVADGMGGHKDGGIAAGKLIEQAKLWYSDEDNDDLVSIIHNAHQELNSQDFLGTSYSPENSPRTTGVILWINGEDAEVVHVGDSRCYRFHSSEFVKRTLDHSIVQLLVLSGEVAEEEMGTHPDQNRLTQSIGGQRTPKPSHEKFKLKEGDAFILCSDGFWEHTTEREMSELLDSDNIQLALEQRSHIAVERAGDRADNTTVIMIKPSSHSVLPPLVAPKRITDVYGEQIPPIRLHLWGITLSAFVILIAYFFYVYQEPTLPEDRNELTIDESIPAPEVEPIQIIEIPYINILPFSPEGSLNSQNSEQMETESTINGSSKLAFLEDQNQTEKNENMVTPENKPIKLNVEFHSEDMFNFSPKVKLAVEDNKQPNKQPKLDIIDESPIEIILDSEVIVENGKAAVEKVTELLRERERLSEGSILILSNLEPDLRKDGGRYYRAYQRHKGILVDEIDTVIEVDEAGKLLRVNSDAISIKDDMVLEPEITWEEAMAKWLDENNHARYESIESPEMVIHVGDSLEIQLAHKLIIEVFDEGDNLVENITLYLSAKNGAELSRYPSITH